MNDKTLVDNNKVIEYFLEGNNEMNFFSGNNEMIKQLVAANLQIFACRQ